MQAASNRPVDNYGHRYQWRTITCLSSLMLIDELTDYDLVTPYGDKDLGQH